MEEYKGSMQEVLGISEERTKAMGVIAEGLAKRMDSGELNTPSKLLLEIEKLEITPIEKLVLAFRFGQVV